jgi:hypothetical protein
MFKVVGNFDGMGIGSPLKPGKRSGQFFGEVPPPPGDRRAVAAGSAGPT